MCCNSSSYFLLTFSSPSSGSSNFMLLSWLWISLVASRTLFQFWPWEIAFCDSSWNAIMFFIIQAVFHSGQNWS